MDGGSVPNMAGLCVLSSISLRIASGGNTVVKKEFRV